MPSIDVYGDPHRLFMQSCINRRVFSEHQAMKMYKAVLRVTGCPFRNEAEYKDTFQQFRGVVNQKINSVDLELRRGTDFKSGESYYALVNNNGDAIAQVASKYKDFEIALFRRIVDLIVTQPDDSFEASSMEILSEVGTVTQNRLTRKEAESTLKSFVEDHWLESRGGKYSLSMRTILELQGYLRESYPEYILPCNLCNEIVTAGITCTNCSKRYHTRCCDIRFGTREKRCTDAGCAAVLPPPSTSQSRSGESSSRSKNTRMSQSQRRQSMRTQDEDVDEDVAMKDEGEEDFGVKDEYM